MNDLAGRGVAADPSARTLRVAGISLVVGGLLWQPMLAFQNLAGLHDRSDTWQWSVDQYGFLVAMGCLLVGLVALDRTAVAGTGRLGRWSMRALVLAWAALVLGQGHFLAINKRGQGGHLHQALPGVEKNGSFPGFVDVAIGPLQVAVLVAVSSYQIVRYSLLSR